jgi:hypothetical protein
VTNRMAAPALALALALLTSMPALGSAGTATTVEVTFLQGEQMTTVDRSGSSVAGSVRALLSGPTGLESRQGVTTRIPPGTRLLSVRVARGVATVDLDLMLPLGKDRATATAIVAQVVLTVTAVPGVTSARLLVNGRATPRLTGPAPGRAITAREVRVPDKPPPKKPTSPKLLPPDEETFQLQLRLSELGYLDAAGVDGRWDEQTRYAVVAFQKWQGLARDGLVGPMTQAALDTAVRPTPVTDKPGHRVEVLLDKQLALVIDDGLVTRTLTVSTGKPGYETVTGSWRIQRKYLRDWSVPYKTWLPYASYFVGGYAFHEYPAVPSTPASHGCVRTTRYDIKWLYARTPVGTPVTVLSVSD